MLILNFLWCAAGEDTTSSIGVGELEITPVSAAIARHLGIDLTPEGKAARNRRGLAIIVHGAPMSGEISLQRNPESTETLLVDILLTG